MAPFGNAAPAAVRATAVEISAGGSALVVLDDEVPANGTTGQAFSCASALAGQGSFCLILRVRIGTRAV